MPYSPEAADKLRTSLQSTKDQISQKQRADALEATATQRKLVTAIAQSNLELRKQTVEIAKGRETRLTKNGGKVISMPSKRDTDGMYDRIKADFPSVNTANPQVRLAAESIAYNAKVMRQKNPALSPEQAKERAYMNRKKDLQIESTSWYESDKLTYKSSQMGNTPLEAYPIEPEASKRKVDKHYNLPNGQIGVWTGSGWKLPDVEPSEEED
jgi:hypothetical protein